MNTDFKLAGNEVSGLEVINDIPNMSSISASLTDYTILKGIREIPFSSFTQLGKLSFYSFSEKERTKELAQQIKYNKQIKPLIVVVDSEGPYVLEGGHRFDALRMLNIFSFPALIVLDNESLEKVASIKLSMREKFSSINDIFYDLYNNHEIYETWGENNYDTF